MIGIGIVHICQNDDLWRVALMKTPEHQQAGDIIAWLSNPLPRDLADAVAVRISEERDIPLLNPETNG